MKKFKAILLLFLFVITNSGMAISIHWCGGKLSSVDFFSCSKNKCACGKKAMKPGCCKDKKVQFKVKDDLVKSNTVVFKVSPPMLAISAQQFTIVPKVCFQYSAIDFYHPPPFKPKAPIYLLDRVFLI